MKWSFNIKYFGVVFNAMAVWSTFWGLQAPLYVDFHAMKVRKYQGFRLGSTVCTPPAESYANKLISFEVFINEYQLELSLAQFRMILTKNAAFFDWIYTRTCKTSRKSTECREKRYESQQELFLSYFKLFWRDSFQQNCEVVWNAFDLLWGLECQTTSRLLRLSLTWLFFFSDVHSET